MMRPTPTPSSFLLLLLSLTLMNFLQSEAKCLDKCQYIPSYEWREQCNTCLEIPCDRWCSFTAFIYEGIERGCGLYCAGLINPRGYEQKQFVRSDAGFIPIRYDLNQIGRR